MQPLQLHAKNNNMAKKTAEISTVKNNQFRFLLKVNGNTVARSYPETYTQKHNCIETVISLFPDFEVIDKTKKPDDNPALGSVGGAIALTILAIIFCLSDNLM